MRWGALGPVGPKHGAMCSGYPYAVPQNSQWFSLNVFVFGPTLNSIVTTCISRHYDMIQLMKLETGRLKLNKKYVKVQLSILANLTFHSIFFSNLFLNNIVSILC